MAQSLSRKDKPAAYWETIRDRIDVGAAINVFNGYLKHKHDDKDRAQLAWAAMSKLLPSLQAIAVQIEADVLGNRSDIDGYLAGVGLTPEQIWNALGQAPERAAIEHDPARENSDSAQVQSEATPTPECAPD